MIQTHHPNAGSQWAISTSPAHPALVSEQDFLTTQTINALNRPGDGSTRRYLLAGLLRCGTCRRSLESQWSHGKPCYRCRHGHTTAKQPADRAAVNLHLRVDVILARTFALLSQAHGREPATEQRLAHLRCSSTAHDLAEFLRRESVTIVCHPDRISLDTDSVRVTTGPAASDTHGIKIPRQRACAAAPTCAYR